MDTNSQHRLTLLEKALADYILRYGMTEDARKAMLSPAQNILEKTL